MPLPPYIHRDDALEDRTRYQTVYAHQPGSAAAPTAGLHFTPEILAAAQRTTASRSKPSPSTSASAPSNPSAPKTSPTSASTPSTTPSPPPPPPPSTPPSPQDRRIIAAGTTTTRTLEHCAQISAATTLEPHSGHTSIFLCPGHKFRIVTGLLTNFHLPESTLLMLVSAFARKGREAVLAAYAHAVRESYRFFSYGDCMLIL